MALFLLRQMAGQRQIPDLISYSALVSCCHKNALWILAFDYLAEMQEIKISADNIAYNSAISACAKAGIWEHAFSLLEKLLGGGFKYFLFSPRSLGK